MINYEISGDKLPSRRTAQNFPEWQRKDKKISSQATSSPYRDLKPELKHQKQEC
jgi:hypothetical protein